MHTHYILDYMDQECWGKATFLRLNLHTGKSERGQRKRLRKHGLIQQPEPDGVGGSDSPAG